MIKINKTLRKEITQRMDKETLIDFRRLLDNDVISESAEVNKEVIKHAHKLTEEGFQAKKVARLKYFEEVKKLCDKRLKELA